MIHGILFNTDKCQILPVRTFAYEMCGVTHLKAFIVFLVSKLRQISYSPNYAVKRRTKRPVLSFINRNFFENKGFILLKYNRLVRPQYALEFWPPSHARDITKLGVLQRWSLPYPTNLIMKSHVVICSLEKRRLRGKLTECFKTLNGFKNVDQLMLLEIYFTWQRRSNTAKLKYKQVNSDCTIFFFTNACTRMR